MTILRPLKAIRTHCMDCQGNNKAEVRRCPIATCTLWPYRMGRRPNPHPNIDRLPNLTAEGGTAQERGARGMPKERTR